MNKLISFIAINLVSFSLLAQTVNDIPIKDIDVEYVQIVGAAKFFSTKVVVGIDFGQRTKYFKMGNTIVKDEYGKPVEFNSMIDDKLSHFENACCRRQNADDRCS